MLVCRGSELNDISLVRRLKNIQVITLSVNHISTLADFAYCTSLEELYIRKNNISDLAEILHLVNLPNLRVLWLADNPCASHELYRFTVLRHLPCLKKLDNIAVQQEEVNDALQNGIELELSYHHSTSNDQNTEIVESNETLEKSVELGVADDDVSTNEEVRNQSDESDVNSSSSFNKDGNINPFVMSWEETNKIRTQLGLRPLPVEKVVTMKPRQTHRNKERNANVLQAMLHLINELDVESIEIVVDALKNRRDMLTSS